LPDRSRVPARRLTALIAVSLLAGASFLALRQIAPVRAEPPAPMLDVALAPSASPTSVPTVTPGPTGTLTPTRTPSLVPSPSFTPTATYPFDGTYTPPAATPVIDVPPPAPLVDVDNEAIENILVLGSDSPDNYYRRTDVMILVSINKDTGTVAMWHIPRALFVYIPNHTMDLINVAYAVGASTDYPGGGFGLLKDTFRYNFGIELDHYARVNFPGFLRIIEGIGRLDISVDCAIRDWRLKDPDLDPGVEDNWEMYTLPIGRYQLTPYMALWYVRSRKTTSDLDRGRRQMDVLRALWQQIQRKGLLSQITTLWPQVEGTVDTDMTLADALALAPLAASIDMSNVARYSGELDVQYMIIYTPDNGREVLLPLRQSLLPMIADLLTPATANRLGRAAVSVDVIDASWYGLGYEMVASDRLAWEGFAARPLDGLGEIQRQYSVIYDYTGQTKGSPLPDLQRVVRVDDAQVIRQPDPNRAVDFRVEIGQEYRSCVTSYAEDSITVTPAPLNVAGMPSAACWLHFRAQVNIRSGPSTAYPVVDVTTPNDNFPIRGRSADGAWWQVDDDGVIAWISAEISNVLTTGDCGAVPVVPEP